MTSRVRGLGVTVVAFICACGGSATPEPAAVLPPTVATGQATEASDTATDAPSVRGIESLSEHPLWRILGLQHDESRWLIAIEVRAQEEGESFIAVHELGDDSTLGSTVASRPSPEHPAVAADVLFEDATPAFVIVQTQEPAGLHASAFASSEQTPLGTASDAVYRGFETAYALRGGLTGVAAFYSQTIRILTPEEHAAAQARACRGSRRCGRVSNWEATADRVEVLLTTSTGARHVIINESSPPAGESSASVARSDAGTVVAALLLEERRASMTLTHYAPDGTPRYSRTQRLPRDAGDGRVALRDDGAAFVLVPTQLVQTDFHRVRMYAFDPEGTPLRPSTFPIRGSALEGSVASVNCNGSLYWVAALMDEDAGTMHLDAIEVTPDGRVGARTPIDSMPLPDGAPTSLRFFQGEPLRVACGDEELGVALRFPMTMDPGGGELVFRSLSLR